MRSNRAESFLARQLPVLAFAVFTVAGSVFIAVSKLSGLNPFTAMAVPILLMFGYLALSLFAGRLRMHDEQTGDNLYYMGFLFTLTSLAVSLYQFSASGSVDEVVRNFGVAITSTITGIGLRILSNQMRRDPLDIERTARHELSDMTRRVRTELESVSREFNDHRRVSNQMLEEGFGEIVAQAERTGVQIREAMEKLATEAIKPVQDSSAKLGGAMEAGFSLIEAKFTSIADKVEASTSALDKANSGMSASVSNFGAQVENVAKQLERVTIPDEVLKNEFAPLVKDMAAAVADQRKTTETALKEQQARVGEIAAAVAKVAERADKSLAAMEKSAEAVTNLYRVTENLFRLIQQQTARMEGLAGQITRETRTAKLQPPPEAVPPLAGHLNGNARGSLPGDLKVNPVPSIEVPAKGPEPVVPGGAAEDPGAKKWWQIR